MEVRNSFHFLLSFLSQFEREIEIFRISSIGGSEEVLISGQSVFVDTLYRQIAVWPVCFKSCQDHDRRGTLIANSRCYKSAIYIQEEVEATSDSAVIFTVI